MSTTDSGSISWHATQVACLQAVIEHILNPTAQGRPLFLFFWLAQWFVVGLCFVLRQAVPLSWKRCMIQALLSSGAPLLEW